MTSDNIHILQAFERQPDGSWRCIEAVSIVTPDGTLSVEPGMTFTFGKMFEHLDVAEYLEQLGAQFGS
ncbi:hypothetical protein [uncultured Enterovirga sp.]|uniref:hypothetical protein n=1 Tax=uncultured Enterovirga sp. TaxID=2026352 RepID=UPI0035CA3B32